MSKFLSNAASQEFDSMVKHEYQQMGMLKPAVTVRNNVIGESYNFRRMGKGLANQKSTSDEVTPMDISHVLVPCPLSNWNAPEYTDIFDQAEVNFDEKQELAFTIAGAISRREDQLIIDAMDASTPDAPDVPAGAAGLTVAKLRAAKTELVRNGVPNSELCMAIQADGLEGLLADQELTSSDFNTVKALVNGDVDAFMGFVFKTIEDRDEGGITVTGNIADAWAFHRATVGLAIGIDMKVSVDWIAHRTAWLSNGMFKAGSVVRDNGGLVKVQYDVTV